MDQDTAAAAAASAAAAGGRGVEVEDDTLIITEQDILEEYDVSDEPPPLDSDDDDDDGEEGGMPSGVRFVAEYEDGRLEELDENGMPAEAPPPPDMACETFAGHSGPIYAVAINPLDPRSMLTGGGDDRGFLWSASSLPLPPPPGGLPPVRELDNHGDSVNAVGFSFDGTLAATGAYSGKLMVWDVKTRTLARTLEGPEDVEWIDWHSKGNIIIAGSKDCTIWMWLAGTGDCVKVFTGHEGPVTCGLFTSDGKTIVSGSADGSVRVWGPKLGICKHTFAGYGFHEGPVTALASHPQDGAIVLSGGMDGTARLMHVANKRVLATLVHSEPKAAPAGAEASMAEGNEYEDEEEEDGMDMDDGEGGSARRVEEAAFSVETVGFSHVFNWCATGGMDGTLKIWDLGNFNCRHVCAHGDPATGEAAGVVKLRWHRYLPLVYTAATDGAVRLWDARSGALLQTLTGHEDMILDFDVAFGEPGSGRGDVILTGADDGKAKVFYVNLEG